MLYHAHRPNLPPPWLILPGPKMRKMSFVQDTSVTLLSIPGSFISISTGSVMIIDERCKWWKRAVLSRSSSPDGRKPLAVPHPHPICCFRREKKREKTFYLLFFSPRKRPLQFSRFQFAISMFWVFELKSLSQRENKAKQGRAEGTRWDEHAIDDTKPEQLILKLGGILSIFWIQISPPDTLLVRAIWKAQRHNRSRVKLPSSKSNRVHDPKVALRYPGGINFPEKPPWLSAPWNSDCSNTATASSTDSPHSILISQPPWACWFAFRHCSFQLLRMDF